jgi:hypothetical protein
MHHHPPAFVAPFMWPSTSAPKLVGTARAPALFAPADGKAALPPSPGMWLTVAGLDPQHRHHVLGVADRFGGLTQAALGPAGEPLSLWRALIEDIRPLAQAWDAEGTFRAAEPRLVADVEARARLLLVQIVEHDPAKQVAVFPPFQLGLMCRDLATLWRMQAIASVAWGNDLRRCGFCGWWFDPEGRRKDVAFCTNYHRTALAAGRRPPARFWEEKR